MVKIGGGPKRRQMAWHEKVRRGGKIWVRRGGKLFWHKIAISGHQKNQPYFSMYQLYLFDFYYLQVFVILLAFFLFYFPHLDVVFKANFINTWFSFLPCLKFGFVRSLVTDFKFLIRFPFNFNRLFRYFERDFILIILILLACWKNTQGLIAL